jgi:hypothetical protein
MALPLRPLRGVFRKDYKHMANPPLNSYLINDPIDNSQVIDLTLKADTTANDTVDAHEDIPSDPTINNAETFDPAGANNLLNSSDNGEFDDNSQSVDPFDSVSQTLFARYTRKPSSQRAWCYEFFEITLLKGKFYTPKGSTNVKPKRRYWCKQCT